MKKNFITLALAAVSFTGIFCACDGAEGFPDAPTTQVSSKIYIDASSWKNWYYVDLQAIHDSIIYNPLYDASSSVVVKEIPMTATGDTVYSTGDHLNGQYMNKYKLGSDGLEKDNLMYFIPTSAQPDPENWTFAIHRDNVRTNGGSVYETDKTEISQVTSDDYATATFKADEWSEDQVWDDATKMMTYLVPSQGIKVNNVLSSWLTMKITPPQPSFYPNNHVFILRLSDGTYAALQLADYISPDGKTKCCMTIRFKYPL